MRSFAPLFRFIRYDANEALDAFAEHCTINKVVISLAKLGSNHKHVVARTTTGRILAHICTTLGGQAIHQLHNSSKQKDSKDTLKVLVHCASHLMCDGSLDVRQEAKKIFLLLMEDQDDNNFEALLQSCVPMSTIQKIRKQLDNLSKQHKTQS